MNSCLVLEYEFSRDGDDFGWLIAKVETPEFGGRNGMWVQWQDLRDLAESLRSYPIEPSNPPSAAWGFGENGSYVAITKFEIAPKGKVGGLVATVALANQYEPENRCQTYFETDYPSLAEFQRGLEAMMKGAGEAAKLVGHRDP